MKKTNVFKVFISVIALVAFFGVTNVFAANYGNYPDAAKAVLERHDNYSYSSAGYGSYNTSRFWLKVTDASGNQLASSAPGICMTPMEASPADGTVWSGSQVKVLDNTELVKYLYYGLCPSGCTNDVAAQVFSANHNGATITDGQRTILVHNALSYVNDPANWKHGLNSTAVSDTQAFISRAGSQEYPTGAFAYKVGNSTAQTVAFLYTTTYGLSINKRTTSNASGVSLAGAEYTIYANNSCTTRAVKDRTGAYYENLVTNAQGNTQQVNVVTRKNYWIKETKRPIDTATGQENTNFELDETCHLCDLYNNNSCTVTSQDDYTKTEKGSVTIKKVDNNNRALKGAIFTIYKDTCGTGEVVTSLTLNNLSATRSYYNLELDQAYCVRETQVPSGYTGAEDQTFTLNTESPTHSITLTFVNTPTPDLIVGSVKLKKVDQDGNPLPGAQFTLYDTYCRAAYAITTFTSGADGIASINNLAEGKYCVKETQSPTGYKLDSTTKSFEVNATKKDWDYSSEPFENTIIVNKGRIHITKLIDATHSIHHDFSNKKYYNLSGTQFTIYNGDCNNRQDIAIPTVTIPDDQDYVYAEDLDYGTYCVKETKAPKGFANTSVEQTVTINENTVDSTATVYISFEDIPEYGSVKLIKKSSNPKITESDPKKYSLKGAQFTVYDENHNDMGTLTIGEDGTSNTITDLPFGKYYAEEVEAPSSGKYEKVDPKNIFPVVIDQENPVGIFTATDKLIKGKAYINKVPAEEPDGTCTLEGAEYKVCTDEDIKGDDCITLVTGKDGKTQTVELEPGTYYFQEQKAPDCFEINPEIKKVIVASGETVVVDSKEELIPVNPQTGIDNPYLITITTVAIGGAGLYFLRRKNAFRQI